MAQTTNTVVVTPSNPPASTNQLMMPPSATTSNTHERIHVFVTGRVQGVGFRAFTRTTGQELHLKGWVRNLDDGRVEFVAEGPSADLDRLLRAVNAGPPSARVDQIEKKQEPYTGEFKDFSVR